LLACCHIVGVPAVVGLLPYCWCPCCCCRLCSCWRPCCCWLTAKSLVSLRLLAFLLLLASLLLLACCHIVGVPAVAVIFVLVGVPAIVGLMLYGWRPCYCWLDAILLASLLLLACCHSVGVPSVAGVSAVAGDPADSEESVLLFQHIFPLQISWTDRMERGGVGLSHRISGSFPFLVRDKYRR
jgi:hypothetical protein